jgi:hypothetical protein
MNALLPLLVWTRFAAYAAILVVLMLACPDVAQAQSKKCNIEDNCNAAEALSACESYQIPIPPTLVSISRRQCILRENPNDGFHDLLYWGIDHNGVEQGQFFGGSAWYYKNTCSSEPSKVTPFFPPSGSVRCVNGCEVTYRANADDTTTYSPTGKICQKKPDCAAQGRNMVWNAMLGVCQPVDPTCPEGQVKVGNTCADEQPCPDGMALVNGSCKKKDEECPAGMTRSPLGNCIPGDGQCAAGEARGKDGTCKNDEDGDGSPDEEEEPDPETPGEPGEKPADEFSGGDTCTAPPSCSGSPIMCGQARIQWRIDCNTRRNNNISGGQCTQAGMPVCTGEKCNAMEYTQLIMQWRSACAAEKLASKSGDSVGGSNTDANGNGVADALEGVGQGTAIGDNASDVAGAKKWGIGLSTSMLDTENMLGGGSCPPPPSITIMGTTVSGADMPYFCQVAAILRVLILGFGAYYAIQILLGRVF